MIRIEKIYDITTGEETIIEREETAAETKERLDNAAKIAVAKAETEAKAIARKEILNRLGITDEEAALLLG